MISLCLKKKKTKEKEEEEILSKLYFDLDEGRVL